MIRFNFLFVLILILISTSSFANPHYVTPQELAKITSHENQANYVVQGGTIDLDMAQKLDLKEVRYFEAMVQNHQALEHIFKKNAEENAELHIEIADTITEETIGKWKTKKRAPLRQLTSLSLSASNIDVALAIVDEIRDQIKLNKKIGIPENKLIKINLFVNEFLSKPTLIKREPKYGGYSRSNNASTQSDSDEENEDAILATKIKYLNQLKAELGEVLQLYSLADIVDGCESAHSDPLESIINMFTQDDEATNSFAALCPYLLPILKKSKIVYTRQDMLKVFTTFSVRPSVLGHALKNIEETDLLNDIDAPQRDWELEKENMLFAAGVVSGLASLPPSHQQSALTAFHAYLLSTLEKEPQKFRLLKNSASSYLSSFQFFPPEDHASIAPHLLSFHYGGYVSKSAVALNSALTEIPLQKRAQVVRQALKLFTQHMRNESRAELVKALAGRTDTDYASFCDAIATFIVPILEGTMDEIVVMCIEALATAERTPKEIETFATDMSTDSYIKGLAAYYRAPYIIAMAKKTRAEYIEFMAIVEKYKDVLLRRKFTKEDNLNEKVQSDQQEQFCSEVCNYATLFTSNDTFRSFAQALNDSLNPTKASTMTDRIRETIITYISKENYVSKPDAEIREIINALTEIIPVITAELKKTTASYSIDYELDQIITWFIRENIPVSAIRNTLEIIKSYPSFSFKKCESGYYFFEECRDIPIDFLKTHLTNTNPNADKSKMSDLVKELKHKYLWRKENRQNDDDDGEPEEEEEEE